MEKAVILDMDGVIRHLDREVAENASRLKGFDFEELMDVIWDNEPGYELLCGRSTRDIWWEQVQSLDSRLNGLTQDFFWKEVLAKNYYDREIIEFVRGIRQHFVTGILTNCDRESKLEIIRNLGPDHPFEQILSSSDFGAVKPEERIFHSLLETLDVKPESCIFFDDRIKHVEGARAVGIQAHLFEGIEQLRKLVRPT
ncbi:MAG: HAD-IA family hydrolase [Promethearchaeota archaeon]